MDNMNPEKPIGGSEPTKRMGLSERELETIAKVVAVGVAVGGMGVALTGCEKTYGAEGTPNSHVSFTDKQTPSMEDLISATIERTKKPTATQNPTEIVIPTQNPTETVIPTTDPTVEITPTQIITPEVTPSPAPIDNLKIPEGLSQEDYNVRLAIKGAFNANNAFAISENEVKQYIVSGETSGFNTFELIKDANNKPAFVVIKGGDNGYTPDQMTVIKRTLTKMNQIDSGVVRSMADYGLRVLAYDINNEGIFDKNSGYGGTYRNYDFGGVVFANTIDMYINDQIVDFSVMSGFIMESRALYTLKYSPDNHWYTNAPDRLSDKIGLDKAYLGIQMSNSWFSQNKINSEEKLIFQTSCNVTINYYQNKP